MQISALDKAVYQAVLSKHGQPAIPHRPNNISDARLFDAIVLGILEAATTHEVLTLAFERAQAVYAEYRSN